MSMLFEILKISNYHDKTLPLSITKVPFGGFGCKIKTAGTVLDCK